MIAWIPSCERKVDEKPSDSLNSIVRKKKYVKGSVIAQIPLCEKEVLWDGFVIAKNPRVKGFLPKAQDNNKLCPKSQSEVIPTKGPRQQQVVA
jgi:hypothetical protein